MRKPTRRLAIVVGAAGLGLAAIVPSALAFGGSDGGSLVNVSGNSVPVTVSGNNIPVAVLSNCSANQTEGESDCSLIDGLSIDHLVNAFTGESADALQIGDVNVLKNVLTDSAEVNVLKNILTDGSEVNVLKNVLTDSAQVNVLKSILTDGSEGVSLDSLDATVKAVTGNDVVLKDIDATVKAVTGNDLFLKDILSHTDSDVVVGVLSHLAGGF